MNTNSKLCFDNVGLDPGKVLVFIWKMGLIARIWVYIQGKYIYVYTTDDFLLIYSQKMFDTWIIIKLI